MSSSSQSLRSRSSTYVPFQRSAKAANSAGCTSLIRFVVSQ
jgi:hypothetical protein